MYSGTFEGTWLTDECDAVGELVLPSDRQLQARYAVESVVTRLSKRYGIDDVNRDEDWQRIRFPSPTTLHWVDATPNWLL